MKRYVSMALGLLATLGWVGAATAQEHLPNPPKDASAAPAAVKLDAPVPHEDCGPCMMAPCCEPAHCGGGLQAGIGFYYVQPHWENNPAYFAVSSPNEGTFVQREEDFDYDFEFSPRAWVGFAMGDGAGARIRFWYLDAEASTSVTDPGAGVGFLSAAPLGLALATNDPGDTGLISGDLRLEVWDFEGTYDWKPDCWTVTFFGGIRYAHLSQSYVVTAPNQTGGIAAALSSGHNFNVWGPTGGLETRRPLGGMGLELYGSTRASILFGHGQQTAGLQTDIGGGEPFSLVNSTSRDDILPVLEAELGAEWSRDLGGMRAFLNVALVGQAWFGAGSNSRSEMLAFGGMGPAPFGATGQDTNLGFFGITVSGGVSY